MKSHRLFVGNIPSGTREKDISAEFGAYGVVESIEIKTKPNPLNESIDTFGFVTLKADENTVSQCIKEFQEQKYEGVYLNVSKARESFLDRLKREREEAEAQKQCAPSLHPYEKPDDTKSSIDSSKPLPTLPTLRNDDGSSSSDSTESESDEEADDPSKCLAETFQHSGRGSMQQVAKPQDEIVRKWNQETYIEHGKLKIIPITGQVKEVIERSKFHQGRSFEKRLGDKARVADEKRKQGLTKLKSAYDQQKLKIKGAFSGESLNRKRKFALSDDEDESENIMKLSLFDGQEEDDGFQANFTIRKQLTGEGGQQLYEMQTTYQADNRFRLDSRFLDDVKVKGKPRSSVNGSDKERLKQLEILSNVTGKPVVGAQHSESKKTLQMHRFDPSQQEENTKNKEPEMRVKMSEFKRVTRREEDFKVSEQKFYTVSENLLSSVGTSKEKERYEGFSLLSMFGKATEANQHDNEIAAIVKREVKEKQFKSGARFRHESSDSEEEHAPNYEDKDYHNNGRGEIANDKKHDGSRKDNVEQRRPGYYSKQGIWNENFFFLPNDTRFDDGRKFFGIYSIPAKKPAPEQVDEGDEDKKQSNAKDIRRIFKKRRQRECKNIRRKSNFSFKVMKKKNSNKMNHK